MREERDAREFDGGRYDLPKSPVERPIPSSAFCPPNFIHYTAQGDPSPRTSAFLPRQEITCQLFIYMMQSCNSNLVYIE